MSNYGVFYRFIIVLPKNIGNLRIFIEVEQMMYCVIECVSNMYLILNSKGRKIKVI